MYRVDAHQLAADPVVVEGATGVRIQWLIDELHGAGNFALRRFIVAAGGRTALHAHDWEHEVYVLRGHGMVITPDGEHEIGPDVAIFVPPGETHRFCALPDEPLEFICIVPVGPATKR